MSHSSVAGWWYSQGQLHFAHFLISQYLNKDNLHSTEFKIVFLAMDYIMILVLSSSIFAEDIALLKSARTVSSVPVNLCICNSQKHTNMIDNAIFHLVVVAIWLLVYCLDFFCELTSCCYSYTFWNDFLHLLVHFYTCNCGLIVSVLDFTFFQVHNPMRSQGKGGKRSGKDHSTPAGQTAACHSRREVKAEGTPSCCKVRNWMQRHS